MGYSMDMKGERQPEKLLPEGERAFVVVDMIPETSKAGNDMFVTKLKDVETGIEKTVWLVSVPGKRFMLKQLLTACGCVGGQDGVYSWDFPDVINKTVMGVVEHKEEEWINRQGDTVRTPKANIVEFFKPIEGADRKPVDATPDAPKSPADVQWEE